MFVGRSLNGRVVSLLNDDAYNNMHQHQNHHPQQDPHFVHQPNTQPGVLSVAPAPPRPEKKRNHVCTTCTKAFTTSGHLARHIRVHTGERNHKCPFPGCETKCSRQDNLQQHFRIHLSPRSRRSTQNKRASMASALGAATLADRAVLPVQQRKVSKTKRDREIYTPTPPASPVNIVSVSSSGVNTPSPNSHSPITLQPQPERSIVKSEDLMDHSSLYARPSRGQYVSPPPDSYLPTSNNGHYSHHSASDPAIVLYNPSEYPQHREPYIHNISPSSSSAGGQSSFPSPISAPNGLGRSDLQTPPASYASSTSSPNGSEDNVIMLQPAPQSSRYYTQSNQYQDYHQNEDSHQPRSTSSSFSSYHLPPLVPAQVPSSTPRSALPPIGSSFNSHYSQQQQEFVDHPSSQSGSVYGNSQSQYRSYGNTIEAQQYQAQSSYTSPGFSESTAASAFDEAPSHHQQSQLSFHQQQQQPLGVQNAWR